MVEFDAKCEFLSQQYDTRFSDQCKRTLALHSVSLPLVLILWYSEVCLKAISRAKKSALEMKIGRIVHHTLLFLKRFRHLEFLVYVFCYVYSASKSGWDAKNWISSLHDIERCMGQASKIIFDEKQGQ